MNNLRHCHDKDRDWHATATHRPGCLKMCSTHPHTLECLPLNQNSGDHLPACCHPMAWRRIGIIQLWSTTYLGASFLKLSISKMVRIRVSRPRYNFFVISICHAKFLICLYL